MGDMKTIWNERYQTSEYIYGTEPNVFFRQSIDSLSQPGRLLLPAEGEGRNAVYAALKGWAVDAYDSSEVGRDKALHLAAEHGVVINYEITNHHDAKIASLTYNAVVLIFAHIHENERRIVHQRCAEALAPGGRLILEAYSKEQLRFGTGGPSVVELLYSLEAIRADFEDALTIDRLEQVEVEIQEGRFHNGVSSVIRLLATRLG